MSFIFLGTKRAQFCWKGNQMFEDLDNELHFGFQKNGSLVIAFNEEEMKELKHLQQQGMPYCCLMGIILGIVL